MSKSDYQHSHEYWYNQIGQGKESETIKQSLHDKKRNRNHESSKILDRNIDKVKALYGTKSNMKVDVNQSMVADSYRNKLNVIQTVFSKKIHDNLHYRYLYFSPTYTSHLTSMEGNCLKARYCT